MYIAFVRYVLITILLDVCSLSPEVHGAKQRASPPVRGLLSCNDLQPCIPQKLCKVTDPGTRASWPMQHGVWPLCGNTLLFLFTYQPYRCVGEFCSGNSVVTHICVTWKLWKSAATPWSSRIAYLPRQVYDLDQIYGFVFENNQHTHPFHSSSLGTYKTWDQQSLVMFWLLFFVFPLQRQKMSNIL